MSLLLAAAAVRQQAPAGGGGGIAYEASYSTTATIDNTRSPSFTLGSAPPADTILVAWIGTTLQGVTLTIPSGWDNILGGTTDVESDQNHACALMHRVTSGEAGASTVTWTLTNLFEAVKSGNLVVNGFSGCNTSDALDVASSTFDSGNFASPHILPGLTPGVTGGLMVGAVFVNGLAGGGYSSGPTGWTARDSSTATSTLTTSFTRDTLTTASTPIANTNLTPNAGDEYCGISAVLIPA